MRGDGEAGHADGVLSVRAGGVAGAVGDGEGTVEGGKVVGEEALKVAIPAGMVVRPGRR